MFKSLKTKIIAAAVAIIIVSFAVFSIISSSLIRSHMESVILDKSISETKQIAKQVEILIQNNATTDDLQAFVEQQIQDNSYIAYDVIVDTNVTAIAHSDSEKIGKVYDDDYTVSAATKGEEMSSKYYADVQKAWAYDVMVPIYNPDGSLFGSMDVGIYENYVDSAVRSITATQVVMIVIICIIAIILLAIICTFMFKNFKYLVEQCEVMGSGDFSHEIDKSALKQKDEIGAMSIALNKMRVDLAGLINTTKTGMGNISNIANSLEQNAQLTKGGAEQIGSAIQDVLSGSQSQSELTAQTSQMTKEITEGMTSVANNIQVISESSDRTLDNARHGDEVISAVTKQMDQINEKVSSTAAEIQALDEKSKEIGKAVELITDIASQTNLLALNASIEAARAGEQGKGFSVVANQVSVLADQSAQAAKEIVKLITEVQNSTDASILSMKGGTDAVQKGIELAGEAGENFKKILSDIKEISQEISGVSAASEQVNASTANLLNSINSITEIATSAADNTQTVFDSVQQQNDNMNEISNSSEALAEMSDKMTSQVNIFKL